MGAADRLLTGEGLQEGGLPRLAVRVGAVVVTPSFLASFIHSPERSVAVCARELGSPAPRGTSAASQRLAGGGICRESLAPGWGRIC